MQRLLGKIDVPYGRLIEPFAGSAAAFFTLRPRSAILCDNNMELINVYNCIRKNPGEIVEKLQEHNSRHNATYYYEIRATAYECDIDRAARLLYLNRTCWNALYRVNRRGQFNVPIGTKTSVILPTDDFEAASIALSEVELIEGDFEKALTKANRDDLIFSDPPYFSSSNAGTFVKYTNPTFSWADQVRLAREMKAACARGAHFILTNAHTPELLSLYGDVGFTSEIERHSVISGQSKGRKKTSELLWTSFPLHL